ncbi:MAG: polysaccharide deacetylase family protein [Lachnospiraceae bacterium]|nr:polysaccharide deacetylase family protein [Lachnospiraceae bacterium]
MFAILIISSPAYNVIKKRRELSPKELPIYCVKTEKPQVALSFDAAWGNKDTGKILAILKENDVKATFFMTGGWVSQYPDDVKAIYESGNDLGNHSENHKQMSLFRPPYGDYDNHVITTAKECGYYSIQWSVDSLDWKNYGAIILMHNGAKYTAEALPNLIKGLKDKGFEIVLISDLIYKDNYHMEHDGCQVSNQSN